MRSSGLISPIASMPDWAQQATRLNPMRYIITARRELFAKGSSLAQLSDQFGPLCLYGIVASVWAVVSFSKKNKIGQFFRNELF